MMGTFNCIYETPCGWCTKWDKKCDKKIPIDNSLLKDFVKKGYIECDHQYEWQNSTSLGNTTYRCIKCGAVKVEGRHN